MTETEMLRELRIIVAKVARVDRASGRAPAMSSRRRKRSARSWCRPSGRSTEHTWHRRIKGTGFEVGGLP